MMKRWLKWTLMVAGIGHVKRAKLGARAPTVTKCG